MQQIVKCSRKMLQKLGRDPTPDEIAKKLGWEGMKVRRLMKMMQEPLSLESPVGEDREISLGEFVEDPEAESPFEAASFLSLKDQVRKLLSKLTPRQEMVLRYRFGLDVGYPRTLEEVGGIFQVTRERIRQIEAKAIARLRYHSSVRKLVDFFRNEGL